MTAEISSQALVHDMQLLELVFASCKFLQFIDIFKFAAEMGSQALEHDMKLLELVLAGVWAWSASH